ncbi:response regulator [Spirosoma spitsbergense]|uniref:response regulator n=1 Tax=Spirosoma spitsbergense TaxID=431554 RepID=UPI000365DE1A|nr:response regulator [Spirosoma spitsbergense]
MKFSLPNRLYIGFSIAILLVFLSGLLSYQTFQRQLESANWVEHTYQVLNQAQTIEKLIDDMETGRIRYRSTGFKQFLTMYNNALRRIKPTINELKALMVDNPTQADRVSRIEANVETLLVFWNKQTRNRPVQFNQEEYVDLIVRQKVFSDKIKSELARVIQTERLLLTQRKIENEASVESVTYKLILSTFLTLLIVLSLIYFTIKGFRSNRRAQAALQENNKELEHLNQVGTEKNWLLTGISLINDNLQQVTDVASLSQSSLTILTTYLDLPASGFYCYNEKSKNLQLNASVALPGHIQKIYDLGEGLVGQAATKRTLTVVNDVPLNFWEIQAGSSKAQPGQVVFLPLWYNKVLRGVMELATFRPLSEQALLLLTSVANNIAVAINAADDHEKVMNLLEQVQEQKEALENQQGVLQQSNSELQRQAEVLQGSERELIVQEEELRQINSELRERNIAVESAQQELTNKARELEVSSKFKSEFLANMSHELRTPLNSVLILARLLAENKQQNLVDKQIEYANIIYKSGTDLLELINDILDLSKIEAGKIEFLFEQAITADIAEDMNQLFGVVANEKGIHLSTKIGDKVPDTIWTDKQRLEQIIKNLLSNAVKFTPKGGSVSLVLDVVNQSAGRPANHSSTPYPLLSFSVTDTGIGISPEKQQIIFEAFQQVDGSISRKFGGTGLGLSISKELVRRLGGEFSLQSEVGVGSTFTVYLPLGVGPNKEQVPINGSLLSTITSPAVSTQPAPPADDRANLEPGDSIILIIEDDPAFAGILQEFARDKNFKTIIALRGDEGLQYARQYKPSAIILDMGLPIMNGWDLLKILQNDDTLSHIPIHIISARDEPAVSGNDILSYTTKPVGKKELENVLSTIKNYLSNGGRNTLALSNNLLPAKTGSEPVRAPLPQPAISLTTKPVINQAAFQGQKVLLVDDDMRNVFALSTLLEANQLIVVTAGDGQEALDQLNEHPDTAIVLMDIMMPEMDGYEATRHIRANPRFSSLPVIALTAKAMTGDREKCIDAGASDYITKPVDSTQLFALMQVWLSR